MRIKGKRNQFRLQRYAKLAPRNQRSLSTEVIAPKADAKGLPAFLFMPELGFWDKKVI